MKQYRMTDEELTQLRDASKAVPYMVFGGQPPMSPRENAMRVWSRIAARVGCKVDSIGPASTGDPRDFEAEPKEKSNDTDNS